LQKLATLRRELRGRLEMSPLMDGKRFALSIEAVYRQVWRNYCGSSGR
jgi:protein O-GlcNAc transferase